MELIPAIDLMSGNCVRLEKGDFLKQTIYSNDPLSVAKKFEDAGVKRLHIVDLDGAKGKPLQNISVLEKIAGSTSLIIDFGGGIKNTPDAMSVFNAGASMISVGSVIIIAPKLFEEWVKQFGADKFLPGADVLDKKIKIHGWEDDAGVDIFRFIKSIMELNIDTIFCTDISKDGMMQGPSIDLYKEIIEKYSSLHLIASGGISCYNDLIALKEAGCSGAIIGKAFYEGNISIKQISSFIKN